MLDRARIERALKNAMAEEEFLIETQRLEELSYNATSLADVAQEMGLEVKNAGPFSRSGGFGVAAQPNVIDQAFSESVLEDDDTSPLISLSDDHVLVLRKTNYEPSRVLAFDEVKSQVVAEVKQTVARQRVEEMGIQLQTAVRQGETVEAVAKANGYEWNVSLETQRTNPQVRRELLDYVFALGKPGDAPIISGLSANNGDYFVLSMFKVVDGEISDLQTAEKRNLNQRLAAMSGESDFAALVEHTSQQANVER